MVLPVELGVAFDLQFVTHVSDVGAQDFQFVSRSPQEANSFQHCSFVTCSHYTAHVFLESNKQDIAHGFCRNSTCPAECLRRLRPTREWRNDRFTSIASILFTHATGPPVIQEELC